MTKRDEHLDKHLSFTLHESVRDGVYDAMEEHACEFLEWAANNDFAFYTYFNGTSGWKKESNDFRIFSTKELHKQFNKQKTKTT